MEEDRNYFDDEMMFEMCSDRELQLFGVQENEPKIFHFIFGVL
jgi:hypothetical protein